MTDLIDKDKIRASVEARMARNPRYSQLAQKCIDLSAKGKLVQAIGIRQQLKDMVDEEIRRYAKKLENQFFSMKEVESALGEANRAKFRSAVDVITILVDILDTCVRNLDETLASLGELHVEAFNVLKELGEEAKHIMGRSTWESPEHRQLYADYLDSIEDYIFKRAKVWHRKQEEFTAKQSRGK